MILSFLSDSSFFILEKKFFVCSGIAHWIELILIEEVVEGILI